MNSLVSSLCEIGILVLAGYNLIVPLFSRDKTRIWSPISTISLAYIYYCSWPFWGKEFWNMDVSESQEYGFLFHLAAFLSYAFVMIGMRHKSNVTFHKWNTLFDECNSGKLGIAVFFIAFVCYASVRGVHFSIAADYDSRIITGGISYYLMFMIECFAAAGCLLLVALKNDKKKLWYWIPFWFILVTYIVSGARWRIVVFVVSMLTTFYLYPRPKKVNIAFIAVLAFTMYIGFSIMDVTRNRSVGIDMEKARSLSYDDVKGGAAENVVVYEFSSYTMEKLHQTGKRYHFAPIIQAILMPIPRAIFPNKPNAEYIHEMERIVIGDDQGGAAFTGFVEAYMAFGWLGILIASYLYGWLASVFWNNYLNNKESIGAIIALGVFSGVGYCVVSRGYLASTLTVFLMVVCLPFWISTFLYNRFAAFKRSDQ